MRALRWPASVAALAVVVALAVLDSDSTGPAGPAVRATSALAAAAPGDGADSIWYCAAGTSTPGGLAEHTVVIVNPTPEAIQAEVSVYPVTPLGQVRSAGDPVQRMVEVSAYSEFALRLSDVLSAPYTAALVEPGSGLATVEHRLQGPTGSAAAPCSNRFSQAWHFAAGSTRTDADLLFAIFNPFPDRAVARFSFATEDGRREPQELSSVLVPAESLVVVDVGDAVGGFDTVSTTIEAAGGRFVAERLQVFDGSQGLEGLSVSAGAPRLFDRWLLPSFQVTGDASEAIVVYNPGETSSLVDVTVRFDSVPGSSGRDAAIIFEMLVPAQQQAALVVNQNGVHPLPPNATTSYETDPDDVAGFWAALRVSEGPPVAVERFVSVPAGSAGSGIAVTSATPVVATRHVVASTLTEGAGTYLAITNPASDAIAVVTVSIVTSGVTRQVRLLEDIEVPALQRVRLPLGELWQNEEVYAVVVEASLPVAVELSGRGSGGVGLSSLLSVPVLSHTSTPGLGVF